LALDFLLVLLSSIEFKLDFILPSLKGLLQEVYFYEPFPNVEHYVRVINN
jgi:hypothetical protein